MTIYFQTEIEAVSKKITSQKSLNVFLDTYLIANQTYLLLARTGNEFYHDQIFITSKRVDIEKYIQSVFSSDILFIMPFEKNDYANVLRYIDCLYEVNEPIFYISEN